MCSPTKIFQKIRSYARKKIGWRKFMDKYNWIKDIDYKKFVAPFEINYDNQYLPELKKLLDLFVDELKKCGAEDSVISVAKRYRTQIVNSIELYYQGNIIDAQSTINELINDFHNDSIAISHVNDSIAFPPSQEGEKSEVQFFRARLADNITDFPAQNMLHIPFSKREIVKSERFSIPGLPCLYLANSTYTCWIEMGCPADHRFNVSPVVLDNTQQIFNLTVSIRDVANFSIVKNQDSEQANEQLIILIKLLMLAMGTSFKVKCGNDRNFKSEYILPQMIMLACKQRKLDGITYYSKQVTDDIFAQVVGVNLVLFACYNGEEELSDICKHIEIGDSFNYSMFKQLMPSLLYKSYNLRILNSPYITNIGTFERQFPYRETLFFEFDQYLFANWNRNLSDNKKE